MLHQANRLFQLYRAGSTKGGFEVNFSEFEGRAVWKKPNSYANVICIHLSRTG
jgi:hypothetical protein